MTKNSQAGQAITNISGRIKDTQLPYKQGLLPLYEAVVNSIHATEEAKLDSSHARIKIEIIRDRQTKLNFVGDMISKPGEEAANDIIGFKIEDNGIGFNQVNMDSFRVLNTDHKVEKGCKGVGRLMWLKAFDWAHVSSTYFEGATLKKISFDVNDKLWIINEQSELLDANKSQSTVVHLDGFKARWRDSSKKTVETISRDLVEHCLWYFLRPGGIPAITIIDNSEIISLDSVFEEIMHSSASSESLRIGEYDFEIMHVKFKSSVSITHRVSYCAANRLVKDEPLKGKIPGLFGKIDDGEDDFIYSCYVSSSYLDENVTSERTDFNIDEKSEGMFAIQYLDFPDIRKAVFERIDAYLLDFLEANKQKGKDRVNKFISNTPRYRPILSRIPENVLAVDPDISDKNLELILHEQFYALEKEILEEGQKILQPKLKENAKDYKERLDNYLKKVDDIKRSDLAAYVSHRRVVLELLENALRKQEDDTYVREDFIHNLIVPMREDSGTIESEDNNLWLLDERLTFHDYLASDMTLCAMPVTSSKETKEPDILSINIFDNPLLISEGQKLPLASITVVELKRPMRNDASEKQGKDPIWQSLEYVDRIRSGKVKTSSGRQVLNPPDIPAYCYVVCDLTPTMVSLCKKSGLTITSDHSGFFGYNPGYKAYIEVISFDKLLNSAKERNRAFFDKLGLPST